MDRTLLNDLHDYFSRIESPNETEQSMLKQIKAELPSFPITYISREDLLRKGYDVTDVSDEEMVNLASEMSDHYCEYMFWESMETTIDNHTDIKKYDEELYVLIEFPEDTTWFENEDIGFSCCFSEDNGARYVPIYDYLEHFRKAPTPKQLYKAVVWTPLRSVLHRQRKYGCQISRWGLFRRTGNGNRPNGRERLQPRAVQHTNQRVV